MKNDVPQGNKSPKTDSKFPMSNRIAKTEKFLNDHDGMPSPPTKSLSEALRERIGVQNEERLENFFAMVNEKVKSGVEYVAENPNDSKLVAAAGELASWVKQRAEPGVKAVEQKLDEYLPKVEAWMVDVLEKNPKH